MVERPVYFLAVNQKMGYRGGKLRPRHAGDLVVWRFRFGDGVQFLWFRSAQLGSNARP